MLLFFRVLEIKCDWITFYDIFYRKKLNEQYVPFNFSSDTSCVENSNPSRSVTKQYKASPFTLCGIATAADSATAKV